MAADKKNAISGSGTLYTYAHLWSAASSLRQSAEEHATGSTYCREAAVLFSAFAVEAYLNHVGEQLVPGWEVFERKISWQDKFKLVCDAVGVVIDQGQRPFQTVKAAFSFRDKLAHGRTEAIDVTVRSDEPELLNPEWLERFHSPEMVQRAVQDSRDLMEMIGDKAKVRGAFMVIASGAAFVVAEVDYEEDAEGTPENPADIDRPQGQ